MSFFESPAFTYVVLPLLIFLARIVDVSMGTVRIILVSKGMKRWVPFIAFFEILIWIVAITRIMKHLDNWVCYIAYAGGFATGNYIGMIIEEKLAMGHGLVRIITKKAADELIERLRKSGYGTTVLDAQGADGAVAVIFVIVDRKNIKEVIGFVKEFNPQALYTIEDIRYVNKNIFFKKR
ncbi:MAG: DUF2179 domain-containing protein [Bacteroidales bacterium]|nr:DUF2179 domain-containing protein [Bacteroidales bacterium]